MPIWLYCQSCRQWSKSDASISDDKTCPLCSNLYISLKPVIDSNPYKVKVNNTEQQDCESQPAEDLNKPVDDSDEETDSGDPGVNGSEPVREPVKEESSDGKKSEMFDFVEILETSGIPGNAMMDPEKNEKKPEDVDEQARVVSEAIREAAAKPSQTDGETDESLANPVIQVLGKASETQDELGTSEMSDKTETNSPGDSTLRKRRIKPR